MFSSKKLVGNTAGQGNQNQHDPVFTKKKHFGQRI